MSIFEMQSDYTQITKIEIIKVDLKKRVGSDYIGRAACHHLFTGAIPLLLNAEPFACYVSILGQCDSP